MLLDCRVNLLEPIILMMHNIAFSFSPINKERFKLSRTIARKLEDPEVNFCVDDTNNWWVLLQPKKLIRLIKRYHLCGNLFIFLFTAHLLFLIHITIKCTIHTFFTGSNRELMEYFNKIYYPHLLGVFPKPYLFNNLFLALLLFVLSARLLAAARLIRGSIINSKRYKEIRISQVNMNHMTYFNVKLSYWLSSFSGPKKHLEQVKTDPEVRKAHFGYNRLVQLESINLSNRDLKFYLNLIDFDDCYEWVGELPPRKSKFDLWHGAKPYHRVPGHYAGAVAVACVAALTLLVTFPTIFGIGVLYVELRSSISTYEEPSLMQVLSQFQPHLSEPLNVLRFSELFACFLFTIPHNLDAGVLYIDVLHLASRSQKLIRIFKDELDLCRQNHIKEVELSSVHHCRPEFNKTNLLLKHQLNERIIYEIKIARVLYSEYQDILSMHTLFINFLIIASGISMAYIISLLSAISTPAELVVLLVLFLAYLIPFVTVLIFCCWVERTVSHRKVVTTLVES